MLYTVKDGVLPKFRPIEKIYMWTKAKWMQGTMSVKYKLQLTDNIWRECNECCIKYLKKYQAAITKLYCNYIDYLKIWFRFSITRSTVQRGALLKRRSTCACCLKFFQKLILVEQDEKEKQVSKTTMSCLQINETLTVNDNATTTVTATGISDTSVLLLS